MIELIEKAYKKLKASVYFDKTQLILRDKIVEFEMDKDWEDKLEAIKSVLLSKKDWAEYENEILSKIEVLTFPKRVEGDLRSKIIYAESSGEISISKDQHFIDLSIEGQVLGIMWVLLVGVLIDDTGYEHSYGNRLKKNLISKNTGECTYSPYLFKPYFEQYESWRDIGLSYAEKCIDANQDVFIFTMDFERYFYNVNLAEKNFDSFEGIYNEKKHSVKYDPIIKRLNAFVFKVMKKYCEVYDAMNVLKEDAEKNTFLPIGFYPSYILSNWYLNEFDAAISDIWNPVYYGRYVDDVIIVEKIEKNSKIYEKVKNGSLRQEDIIKMFLCGDRKLDGKICKNAIIFEDIIIQKEDKKEDKDKRYKIANKLLASETSSINIQQEKVNIFYFKGGCSKSILSSFKKAVNKNKSEFRYLPEDGILLDEFNFSEIFNLKRNDSINKFRSVEGIEVDKFNLSKFLGKYRTISCILNDKKENEFERNILKIFDEKTILESYIFWERVIEILILNDNFNLAYEYIEKIIKTCFNFKLEKWGEDDNTGEKIKKNIQKTLLKHLRSSISRVMSLSWGAKSEKLIVDICVFAKEVILNKYGYDVKNFDKDTIVKWRSYYCLSRMCNNYALPSLVDAVIQDKDDFLKKFNDKKTINLAKYNTFIYCAKKFDLLESEYKYYPYIITMQELEMLYFIEKIYKAKVIDLPEDINIELKKVRNDYLMINYRNINQNQVSFENIERKKLETVDFLRDRDIYVNKIKTYNSKNNGIVRIAIANAKIEVEHFASVLKDNPVRTFERYEKLSKIVNQAIAENSDILVLPEAYIPFEWIPLLARTVAKSGLAIITGIEHIKVSDKVMNYTAVILPYSEGEKTIKSHIVLHNKVHFAPNEKRCIEGYGCKAVSGNSYDLFCYNDFWFSVYCCFELSSIIERALFGAYADATIAVEWNHDTNYYSNIIESLVRDLHCYCIQVNTSDYGDSRIVKPSRTEEKNIVRTKGGINDTVLISDINIAALREFQRKEYELQRDDKSFKPTPPDFDRKIVKMKIKGTLWNYIKENKSIFKL